MATRLDRETIVETALRLLNEEGLEGLTLRRLAKGLDVQAPALYWHFGNKQALLDEMATRMLRDMLLPMAGQAEAGGTAWQDWITDACRRARRTLLGYRDGAKVFSGTHLTDESHLAPWRPSSAPSWSRASPMPTPSTPTSPPTRSRSGS